MSETLWCVHIEGLDDFIATDSQRSAAQEASAINAYLDSAGKGQHGQHGQHATLLRAVAVEWPFPAADHARALSEDWQDLQRMPHRRAQVSTSGSFLTQVTRRVKGLLTVTRGR
ncbi:hypothetical protein LFL96_32455 [Paraburkholderia sp. D15]|uniref:hypothetical protein n=1 Tax=Paraburkholderia sp. D15 TaxID=2880218 RepID=UPI00247A3EC7|nr:hypothetical protein [Paraburkholderia sp. D15]WGS52887.1 hypothetical protein LFL96_32455 [Paraburkholderia sp. D15]WKF61691.1 hypothetical protein HUO10_006223 [Paraburkholderia busanensis]